MGRYKYLEEMMEGETTRKRSKRQETKLARLLKGQTTINSGATLSQNDVVTDYCEIEAKVTKHKSYSITLKEWYKMLKRCKAGKMPIFIIEFETEKKSLAVIDYDDLQFLIDSANKK